MNAIVKQFLETAIWSEIDDDGEPLDENYSIADLHPSVIERAKTDCDDFVESNLETLNEISMPQEDVGHNFLLTRNGHGTGFWDRGLGEAGDKLTKASKPYGGFNLYVGDDGKIYVY